MIFYPNLYRVKIWSHRFQFSSLQPYIYWGRAVFPIERPTQYLVLVLWFILNSRNHWSIKWDKHVRSITLLLKSEVGWPSSDVPIRYNKVKIHNEAILSHETPWISALVFGHFSGWAEPLIICVGPSFLYNGVHILYCIY